VGADTVSRKLIVEVVGDSRSLERTFDKSTRSSKAFGREMTGTFGKVDKGLQRLGAGRAALIGGAAGAGAGIVAPKVIEQLKAAVDVASNLNEQVSKSRVVFGDSSKVIEDWAKTTASGIGVARDQAVEAASTFGAMFRQAGQAGGDAANLSKAVVQLAGDLASFNNTSVDDALVALQSGLSGEIEPLRRFQVFLTEASVQQRAMEQTGKANAKQLTQGEKILARYSLIMEQTTRQQGDFQRTSKGLANQQRILSATVRDLQGNLGQLLVPVMTELTSDMVFATRAALDLGHALGALGKVRIPTIEIPFVIKVGGQSIGDLAKLARFTPLNPLFGLTIAKSIADQFRDQTAPDSAATTQLANDFQRSINTMTENALDTAQKNRNPIKVPPLTPAIEFDKLPGVDFKFGDTIVGAIDKSIAFARKQVADALAKGKAAISKEDARKAAEKQRQGFENLLDAISLSVDRAAATRGFADDLRRNTQLQNAIKRQIAVEGRTTDLARRLFDARQARADIIAARAGKARDAGIKAAQAASAAAQEKQFKALGLSATGDDPVPGIKNLSKRINRTLRNADLGKIDISSKLISRLKAARKLIKTEGGKLTEDTRRVINDFLKAATGQDEKTKTTGPLTKTSALNVNRILDGLGLSRDAEKELRSRLSGINSAGRMLSGKPAAATGGFVSAPFVVESHTTVTLDGDVVGRNVTRSQQKASRRNPPQRRGPNAR